MTDARLVELAGDAVALLRTLAREQESHDNEAGAVATRQFASELESALSRPTAGAVAWLSDYALEELAAGRDSTAHALTPLRRNTPRGALVFTHPAQGQGALYQELLFAVGNKYPNETRHQTALRYIRQAEQQNNTLGAAPSDKGGE